jgi:hypothetical protein|tara:strand:- start:482 stop:1510 length:1029 start_codon:yes stop_codon:yes gene_type:complete
MHNELLFGITESGVMHTDADPPIPLETKFQMVKESGIYDYFDKTPPRESEKDYLRYSEKYDLPILAGGWFYVLGRDDELLLENLRLGGRLGSLVHNTQIIMDHADGSLVSDEQVAEIYLKAYETGEETSCRPTFEVHVNMWSEDFRRVEKVADLVERRGIPFYMTLDHSHVIFKIDNPREQEVFGIRESIEKGDLVLDPFQKDNICGKWIDRGFVMHCHARAAVPNNPRNIWKHHSSLERLVSKHPKDTVGRGIQYPFIKPEPGQWHSEWNESMLEPWKLVLRQLMHYHSTQKDSTLKTISTEFIPNEDYGGGAGYSIFENSCACARWLRETWNDISTSVRK